MITAGFVGFFLLTVLLLAGVIVTGFLHRLRLHIPLVIATVAALGVTIYFAKELGTLYDLEAAGWITPVHLFLARIATLSFLLPATSGVLTLRDRRWRPWHRAGAMIAAGLTLTAVVTGIWMLAWSERI